MVYYTYNKKVKPEGNVMNYIGLNNKECENPKYFCRSHLVYLSESDVAKKKCLCKPTMDMISTQQCRWLIPISEYEEEKKKHKEKIEKIKNSRINENRGCRY